MKFEPAHLSEDEDHDVEGTLEEEDELGIICSPDEDQSINLPFHIRCASHTLSLIATADAKNITDSRFKKQSLATFRKCGALWNACRRPKKGEIVRRVFGCQFSYPVITRWNSLYDAISLILTKKEELTSALWELDLPDFTENDIKFLEEYECVMAPIAAGIDRLQGEKSNLYGYYLPTILSIEAKLDKIDNENLTFAGPLLAKSKQSLKSRFKSIIELDFSRECVMAMLAATTNPDIKLKWITIRSSTDTEVFRRKVLQLLADEMSNLKTCKEETEARPTTVGSDPFFEFKDNSNLEKTASNDVDLEVLNFLNDHSCDVSSLNQYPKIRKVFLKHNTPLPSSAAVERLFSFAGIIHSPKRSMLTDDRLSQLVLLKSNKF